MARNNRRIDRKIGDIVLRPGDTLLLETQADFVERQRNTRDFYLVSHVPDSNPPRFDRAPLASGILLGMVLVVALGWLPMVTGALLAAAAHGDGQGAPRRGSASRHRLACAHRHRFAPSASARR